MPRGSCSRASGFPRVSATIRSRTRSSSGPLTADASKARASTGRRPPIASSGNPIGSRSEPRSRRAKIRAIGSASSRRATNVSACSEASVEPLGVVDHADERSLLGDVGEQAQHRQPDEEAIRRIAGAQPERRAQRIALRAGERVEPPEQRRAQLMQAREGDLHLRLDAAGAHDPAPRRALCDVAQKGRLADAGLPMQDQRAALAAARRVQQPVERVAFASTAQQRRRTPRHHTQRAYIRVLAGASRADRSRGRPPARCAS